jgi:hypothetical protein
VKPLVCRIRLADLPAAWLAAVADLLAAVDAADPVMVESDVRDAADRVRAVLFAGANRGDR